MNHSCGRGLGPLGRRPGGQRRECPRDGDRGQGMSWVSREESLQALCRPIEEGVVKGGRVENMNPVLTSSPCSSCPSGRRPWSSSCPFTLRPMTRKLPARLSSCGAGGSQHHSSCARALVSLRFRGPGLSSFFSGLQISLRSHSYLDLLDAHFDHCVWGGQGASHENCQACLGAGDPMLGAPA